MEPDFTTPDSLGRFFGLASGARRAHEAPREALVTGLDVMESEAWTRLLVRADESAVAHVVRGDAGDVRSGSLAALEVEARRIATALDQPPVPGHLVLALVCTADLSDSERASMCDLINEVFDLRGPSDVYRRLRPSTPAGTAPVVSNPGSDWRSVDIRNCSLASAIALEEALHYDGRAGRAWLVAALLAMPSATRIQETLQDLGWSQDDLKERLQSHPVAPILDHLGISTDQAEALGEQLAARIPAPVEVTEFEKPSDLLSAVAPATLTSTHLRLDSDLAALLAEADQARLHLGDARIDTFHLFISGIDLAGADTLGLASSSGGLGLTDDQLVSSATVARDRTTRWDTLGVGDLGVPSVEGKRGLPPLPPDARLTDSPKRRKRLRSRLRKAQLAQRTLDEFTPYLRGVVVAITLLGGAMLALWFTGLLLTVQAIFSGRPWWFLVPAFFLSAVDRVFRFNLICAAASAVLYVLAGTPLIAVIPVSYALVNLAYDAIALSLRRRLVGDPTYSKQRWLRDIGSARTSAWSS